MQRTTSWGIVENKVPRIHCTILTGKDWKLSGYVFSKQIRNQRDDDLNPP